MIYIMAESEGDPNTPRPRPSPTPPPHLTPSSVWPNGEKCVFSLTAKPIN